MFRKRRKRASRFTVIGYGTQPVDDLTLVRFLNSIFYYTASSIRSYEKFLNLRQFAIKYVT